MEHMHGTHGNGEWSHLLALFCLSGSQSTLQRFTHSPIDTHTHTHSGGFHARCQPQGAIKGSISGTRHFGGSED